MPSHREVSGYEMSQSPHVVIVTGMSGAGRRTAMHAIEDLGWYVVDNLPPSMLIDLVRTANESGQQHVAVGLDVRSRDMFDKLPLALAQVTAAQISYEICFLEANEEAIVRRQESTRRPLPLQDGGSITAAIDKERRMLGALRAEADVVIDTSKLTARQLKSRISHLYSGGDDAKLRFQIMSFGFKNGLPLDADMVFDVRFLPNPYWVPDLRPQTGLAAAVSDYVLSRVGASQFLSNLSQFLDVIAPGYIKEGKNQATIAIGCTGGKHRSVAMSEAVAQRLREVGFYVSVMHRDLGKE